MMTCDGTSIHTVGTQGVGKMTQSYQTNSAEPEASLLGAYLILVMFFVSMAALVITAVPPLNVNAAMISAIFEYGVHEMTGW
jgi:hypothetical protein